MRQKTAGVLLAMLLLSLAGGCSQREKTLALPLLERSAADAGQLRIAHIQAYLGSAYSEDIVCVAWGAPGEDLVYLLRYEDGAYRYETIDTHSDQVTDSVLVEEDIMTNVKISPGGRYFSYEVWGGDTARLGVFFPEQQMKQTLHTWSVQKEQVYSYIWSDDGTKLFSWQRGDTGEPYEEWQVTRYGMESGSDGNFLVEKSQFQMKGCGCAMRYVLPNADGSEAYVYQQPQDTAFDSERDSPMEVDSDRETEQKESQSWILYPDLLELEPLAGRNRERVRPLKYTPAGLFYQDDGGTIFLVEDPKKKWKAKEVLEPKTPMEPLCICEKGDHLFWAEWPGASTYQISGVRIHEGEPEGEPLVLYKDTYESLEEIQVLKDRAVVFWGYGQLEQAGRAYQITALEY